MKLKFQISQTTNIDPATIKGLIALKLKENDYQIQETEFNSVSFYDDPWVMRWNFQAMSRFSSGKFEIVDSDSSKLLIFHYYLNIITPTIIFLIISTICIISGQYYAPLFFLTFYTIAIFFNTIILRGIAKNFMYEILNPTV